MAKRSRESSVEFTIENNTVIINYNGQKYSCDISVNHLNKLLYDNAVDYEVIHSIFGNLILNIEDLHTQKNILCQEINLLK